MQRNYVLNVFGNGYLIIEELSVQWMPSAAKIPAEENPKVVYPVWLVDSLGIRAAIFVRCPICKSPLGISPADASEQKDWNKADPSLCTMLGCQKCSGVWMITENKAYHLQMLPVPSTAHIPRPLTMPQVSKEGGMA